MLPAMDRTELIERLEAFFADRGDELAVVYLFGSRARGTAVPRSDVDLGLLFHEPQTEVLLGPRNRIEGEVEATLGLPVQAVELRSAPPDLVHRVLRDGVLVLETDRSARIRFEHRKRMEYLDLQPVRDLYRRARQAATEASP